MALTAGNLIMMLFYKAVLFKEQIKQTIKAKLYKEKLCKESAMKKTFLVKSDNRGFGFFIDNLFVVKFLLTKTLKFSCMLMAALTLSFISQAEPYLAIKNNLKCMACHVNPNGGGLRNDFGKIYGQSMLPARASRFDSAKIAKLTQFLSIGADARFNANYQKSDSKQNQTNKSFEVASTQFYLNFDIADSGLSFYLDQQVAPGSAINREAYVKYQFSQGHFIKAGKLFLPYGLRIEDDSAFIRQATGMNFDNSDNGVEYGLDYQQGTINFYLANGTSQASNNDDSFLYGVRIEHLFSAFRLGASAILNDGEQEVQMVNFYGGAQWADFTFLAEVDYLRQEGLTSASSQNLSQNIEQQVVFAEINYQWRKGWNFKLTAEYFDPNQNIDEDHQTRHSFVTEYTPISNVQLRLGFRHNEDIPQKPQQNYDVVFLQSHFYF